MQVSSLKNSMLKHMLTAALTAVRVSGWFIAKFSVQVKAQFWVIHIHALSAGTPWHQINTLYNLYASEHWKCRTKGKQEQGYINSHISDAKVVFSSGRNCADKLQQKIKRVQCSWSVSSLMSVFLPKRVKVGSQIDVYRGMLSLCLDLYFLLHSHAEDAV